METTNRSYDQVTSALIDEKISEENYSVVVASLKIKMTELGRFFNQALEDTVEMCAAARILCKSAPPMTQLITSLVRSKYDDRFRDELPGEIAQLKQEIAETRKAAGDRIRSIEREGG